MPNLRASKKDLRKTKKRTLRNKSTISEIKNLIRKMRAAAPEEGKKLIPAAYSLIDKAVQRGIMKKGTGARYKSRISKKTAKK
jgi:small subunit ribosomal protein S20